MKLWYAIMAGAGLAAIIHVSAPTKAQAQTTIVTDGFGRVIEQAYTTGNTTYITNGYGAPIATTTTIGGLSPTQPIIPLPTLALPPLR